MARPRRWELVKTGFFTWRVGPRLNGVYYADGRSNEINVGRQSLGTKDRNEALERLKRLDNEMAVQYGLAEPAIIERKPVTFLPLDEGVKLYTEDLERPSVACGVTMTTRKRYRTVFDKFGQFARTKGVAVCEQVDDGMLNAYGAFLEKSGRAYRTIYLELNTIKQLMAWLIEKKRLPDSARIRLKLRKAQGTNTYCYSEAEVASMLDYCKVRPTLVWLGYLLTLLAYTGMRIGEALQLEWSDVDLLGGKLHVRDETRGGPVGSTRSTKTHKGRVLPIHGDVRMVLQTMPSLRKGRVILGPRGGRIKADTVRVIFKRDLLIPLKEKFPKAGDSRGFEDGRLHSFRHFFCSYSFRSAVSEADIRLWLGHADSEMVTHYRHLGEGESQRQIDKLKSVTSAGAA